MDLSNAIALFGIFVAAIVGIVEILQNRSASAFSHMQYERDVGRHEDDVDTNASRFIAKYRDTIGLLPLCVAACMYDRKRLYHHEMYNEFNALSIEVQNEVLKSCGIVIDRFDGCDFYRYCYDLLMAHLRDDFPDDVLYNQAGLYDNGKYFRRAIDAYGSTVSKVFDSEISERIFDIFNDKTIAKKFCAVWSEFSLGNCSEEFCSDVVVETVRISASNKVYGPDNMCTDDAAYWCWIPPYGSERLETLEDTFLCALLTIYLYLDLDKNGGIMLIAKDSESEDG